MKLRDHVPQEFFNEYMDTPAAKLLDREVIGEYGYGGQDKAWVGQHKNVFNWWLLDNNKAVGWNENPARGWSFPVVKVY